MAEDDKMSQQQAGLQISQAIHVAAVLGKHCGVFTTTIHGANIVRPRYPRMLSPQRTEGRTCRWNTLSIIGSRGHLGAAVGDLLRLYRNTRLPLHDAATGVVHGLGGLKCTLEEPAALAGKHCKVQAQL